MYDLQHGFRAKRSCETQLIMLEDLARNASETDLSLRWAHNHFVGFVMLRLILKFSGRKWNRRIRKKIYYLSELSFSCSFLPTMLQSSLKDDEQMCTLIAR